MEGRPSPRQDDKDEMPLDFHQTYIVQYPKDQVYRVPPPENALIVESYRNPNDPTTKRKKIHVFSCLLTIFLVLLAILFLLAIIIAILYLVYAPTAPAFSITAVAVRRSTISGQKHYSRPRYQTSLTVKNPNGKLGLKYQDNSQVLLLFEDKNAAKGKFPSLEQEPNNSTETKVELAGSNNGRLPKKIEQSMNGSNVPISMDMEMKLGVRMNSGWFKTWLWHCNVRCGFKVSSLRSNGRVISQECHAKLNPWSSRFGTIN